MRVTVAGTGYVGTVTGACLAYLGHRVTCVDKDRDKITMLRRGEMQIYEPHLTSLLHLASARSPIEFSDDLATAARQSDVIIIAVGTPSRQSGAADLTDLESVARAIGAASDESRFRVIVNKSTVPMGGGNLVETLVREGVRQSHPGKEEAIRFGVASNPEFLREGRAVADSLYPDRIVIGSEEESVIATLRDLYAPIITQTFVEPSFLPRPAGLREVPLLVTALTSAEMIKYASNAFLATKIGFANEMANLCERVGADIKEVVIGLGLDSRIGPSFLNAGLGWGGSCFGKDIRNLLHTAYEYGFQSRILEAALDVNAAQRCLAIQKLLQKLFILKGRTIALLGLAFKPDTDDLRDAPSLQIAEKLTQMGARVRAYDPIAMKRCQQQHPELEIEYCSSAEGAAENAHAIVVVTEWPEFACLDLAEVAHRMAIPVLIDGRNIYNPHDAIAAGFDYAGIGRRKARRVLDRHVSMRQPAYELAVGASRAS